MFQRGGTQTGQGNRTSTSTFLSAREGFRKQPDGEWKVLIDNPWPTDPGEFGPKQIKARAETAPGPYYSKC